MKIVVNFDVVVGTDRSKGDLSQGAATALTSDWIHLRGREFSLQIVNTAAGSPQGTWSYEASNDRVNGDAIDTSLLVPTPTNPDGTTTAQHQTITFPGLRVGWFRMKYARTGGGAADFVQANVEVLV